MIKKENTSPTSDAVMSPYSHRSTYSPENISTEMFPFRKTIKDLLAGFISGTFVGTFIAFPESLKVMWQNTSPPKFSSVPQFAKAMLQDCRKVERANVINFSQVFGMVCAIEFSVIARLEEKFGETVSAVASGLSGTFFLTVADHLLFRKDELKESPVQAIKNLWKIRPTSLWAGAVPMIPREIIFANTHWHYSRTVGMQIYNFVNPDIQISDKKKTPLGYRFLGSLVSGPVFAVLTQPCDTMAREMQRQVVRKEPSNLLEAGKSIISRSLSEGKPGYKGFFAGGTPRALLAPFGGASAVAVYSIIEKGVEKGVDSVADNFQSTHVRPR